jgi:SAM-dependent methyltransferase
MSKIRMLSPQLMSDLVARRVDLAPEPPAVRGALSRSFWVGPQDHDAYPDHRLGQLLAFGLVDEAELTAAVAELERRGWLLPAAAAGAEQYPDQPAAGGQLVEAQARLAAITKLAETVAGDAHALGLDALAASADLPARLADVQRQLAAIAAELAAARAPFVQRQLDRLGLAGSRDLKVHLGAGPTQLAGWVNCDVAPAELAFHLGWGLPFADGSVAYAYAGHVFEHLYYAGEALSLLRELRRALAPGGVFRFIVPDMGLFLRKYAAGDRGFFEHWRASTVRYFSFFTTPLELIMAYCFVGREPSEFFGHKMGYDLETLEKLAHLAGFSTVTRSDYMASSHAALRVDEISIAAKLEYQGERYSLFIELS